MEQQTSETTLNGLPLELLDVVIEKSFVRWILNSSSHQREQDASKVLASVDFCWFQRTTRRRFKERIWRQMRDFYGKTKKRSAIVRNNRHFLLENMQPYNELLDSLLSLNCITDEENHVIQLRRTLRDKNAALLDVMRSFDETKFSNFVRCLRQTNQKAVAKIMENGGGGIKVEVHNRVATSKTFLDMQLFHQPIEDLRNKTKLRSDQTDKLMSQLREEGIEILNAQLDRQTVVIWIWCQSQAALENIQRLYESDQLRDIFTRDANVTARTFEDSQSHVNNIDSNQFKKTIHFHGITKKRYAIMINNRNYLLENIQPNNKLIAELLSLKCITEEQRQLIQRQRSKRDKNIELLNVMRSFDDGTFHNFFKCLRQTDQNTVARIMENGGVVIKLKVQTRGAKCTASMETQLLHQKIEDHRGRTKPRSHETDKLISQLKEEGIEIVNSQLDRQTVVVWIWCYSQAALENFQRLYQSNHLKDILFGFADIQPSTSEITQSQSIMISIDKSQLYKAVVVSPISINFTARIDVERSEEVTGVTKLRNEIYVLRKNEISVLDDRHPFGLQKKFEIEEIEDTWDIASCEKENCLYVSDSDYMKKYVWKITTETDDQHKIIQLLPSSCHFKTLSVSNDGYLIVADDNRSGLDIYGSHSELLHFIELSGPKRILQAVETSIGNFILLYYWKEYAKVRASVSSRRIWMAKWGICEVSRDGKVVLHRFIPSNKTQQLRHADYISIDSDDRVFVADSENHRVILLDSDLKWNRILCPTNEKEETNMGEPWRLCYDEEKKQLIVGGGDFNSGKGVNVYTLSRK